MHGIRSVYFKADLHIEINPVNFHTGELSFFIFLVF